MPDEKKGAHSVGKMVPKQYTKVTAIYPVGLIDGSHPRLTEGEILEGSTDQKYKNIRCIDIGGNAAVYMVVGTTGKYRGLLLAAKIFAKPKDQKRLKKFQAEMERLNGLDHPAIVKFYDRGIHQDKWPFFITEYRPVSLSQVIGKKLHLHAKISYSMQLLSALVYLSELTPPMIHLDIKPKNILVNGSSCVLADFGLAHVLEPPEYLDGKSIKSGSDPGTPVRYRTPDYVSRLLHGTVLDAKADVYQLGLVLTELYSGANPQIPANKLTDPVQLDSQKLSLLDSIPGAVGTRVGQLVKEMLCETPERRPSAAELLNQWESVLFWVIREEVQKRGQNPFPHDVWNVGDVR
jgi:eukaryotic-like serine/threonine-protein kinase